MTHKPFMTRGMFQTCSHITCAHTSSKIPNKRSNGGVATQNDVEPRPNQMKSWRKNGGVAKQYDAEPIKRYHSDQLGFMNLMENPRKQSPYK